MGVDRGAAGAALPHQCFLLIRHAAPIKSVNGILRKCLKKKDDIRAKNHPGFRRTNQNKMAAPL